MTNLPTTRQLAPPPSAPHTACTEALAQAFSTFSEAAGSLESTYLTLHDEVRQLRRELEGTNRQLSASLAENERTRRHLEDILRCLPCGVIVADEQGRVLRSNPAARDLLAHLVGGISAAQPDWNVPTNVHVPAAFTLVGGTETEYELVGNSPETPLRTYGICRSKVSKFAAKSALSTSKGFATHAASAEFAGGAASAEFAGGEWVYILRDLTREKSLLQERERARRLTSLAEVSAVLAHEIRNPLASLELFAGLIARSAGLSADQSIWTNHIRAGLRSLAGTVNNVLLLYSQSAPQAAPLDLSELLAQTCDFLRPLADAWRVRIVHAQPSGPCLLNGVAHQLQQVFLNIAMNAFRLSPPGGELRIELVRDEESGGTQVSFTDDGPGITPELLARIFEPGFSTRADSPGIGLAVSRRIIEQHGGTLTAANVPGRGARFAIRLPGPADCALPGRPSEPQEPLILMEAVR